MKYQIIEKIDMAKLSEMSGLKYPEEITDEIFTVGSCFFIGRKRIKIINKIQKENTVELVCYVWN